MAVVTYFYYEKVRRTMRITILSYLLKAQFAFISNLENFLQIGHQGPDLFPVLFLSFCIEMINLHLPVLLLC